MNRLETVTECVSSIDGVAITSAFVEDGGVIVGSVNISFLGSALEFEVRILPAYPLQFHDSESIRFVGKELHKYNHVNADGSICVHTYHSTDLKEKLSFDFASLKEWIKKYYVEGAKDTHYEHIVVPQNDNSVFLFTSIAYNFKSGEFGFFQYSNLAVGFKRDKKIETHIVQQFKIGKSSYDCCWSSAYKNMDKREGLFVFIEKAPTQNTRFAVENWQDLELYVSQEFLKFLNLMSRKRYDEADIPLLVGYKIPNDEIHWQCVMIPTQNFPNYAEKIPGTINYIGRFADEEMSWVSTRNCSPKYFFGRGSFTSEVTNRKVLIIGVGAIGSNVATTLVRGGCVNVTLIDHDIKEPENACRAEYTFSAGINSKINELSLHLTQISPFVEISLSDQFMDIAKITLNDSVWRETLLQKLGEYDLIFDCSTDNDVAYILDQLDRPERIFTLSITNNAKELICAVPPKLYKWMIDISHQLGDDSTDLYNPSGCWSPTFRASYNDIAVLVQFALKHITASIANNSTLRSFCLETSIEDGFNIKLKEF